MLSNPGISRRDLFSLGCTHALGWTMAQAWTTSCLLAGEETQPRPLNRFPRMVHQYFVEQVQELDEIRNQRLEQLHTKSDAESYLESIRKKIGQSFGPFPKQTPLNPRVSGVVERDTYRIEKILFESRPGMIVSANLYIPKNRPFPLPGVIGTCGHSPNGKAGTTYQAFSQALAKQGYVVLIYDPIGQGERLQYLDGDGKSKHGEGVREHLKAGNQQFLVGEFFGAWRAWDGIRALDYLLTRTEVDPQHIGVTGNSGGGTMATWLCGVESRLTMAAPSCFVTTFKRNLENELPADTEQCPPRALALGLEHEEFLAALAPKPIIILGKEQDFFDIRGTELAYARLKKIYRLLGKEENISLFVGPSTHGYSQENREAMYGFFNKVSRNSDVQTEPQLQIEQAETLWCCPEGQVGKMGAKRVLDFTREKSQHLQRLRSTVPSEKLSTKMKNYLRLPSRKPNIDYHILHPLWGKTRRGYPEEMPHGSCYAVETEPGIEAIVVRLYDRPHFSRPRGDGERAILYVPHYSSDSELRSEPLIRELLRSEPKSAFYSVDVRGTGETRPNTCGENSFFSPHGSDYFYAIHSIMLDRPYPIQRTHDLLCVLDWLQEIGHHEVHLVGKGWGAILATLAGVLHDEVKQVTLKNHLTSYTEIAESEDYDWPLSALLPGVLEYFDLPDCYAALESKNLRQLDPWGAKYLQEPISVLPH